MAYTPHNYSTGDTLTAALLNANEQGTQAAAAAADTANSGLSGKVNSSTYTAGLAGKADYPAGGTDGQSLVKSGSTTAWATVSAGGTVSDASTTAKGVVQLAGDLAGTAASPTVPGLAGKLTAASNLSDVANAATARTNLGLGTAATSAATAFDASGAAAAAQAAAVQRANHTGTQSADTLTDGTTNKAFLATERTKLTGIATGATANVVGAAGSGAGNALSANDPTTTNSRTPTAHASTHASGGSDAITPAAIGAAPLLTTQTTQTGTAYTFVLADGNTLVESNNAAAVTFTVPPNSSAAFPVGASIALRQYGAGQVTVAAGAGVTLRSRGSAVKTAGQYAEATLTQRATDEWVLSGDLA